MLFTNVLAIVGEMEREVLFDVEAPAQALDSYIGYCSTYGGDYTGAIAEAINKCFDALIEGKPFCDRQGLIDILK